MEGLKKFFLIIRDSNNVYIQDTSLYDTMSWQTANLYIYNAYCEQHIATIGFQLL